MSVSSYLAMHRSVPAHEAQSSCPETTQPVADQQNGLPTRCGLLDGKSTVRWLLRRELSAAAALWVWPMGVQWRSMKVAVT